MYKTAILNAIFPKWVQNVSEFILFHKCKMNIFKFLSMFIFLKCFCRYLKTAKYANMQTVTNVTQTRKVV